MVPEFSAKQPHLKRDEVGVGWRSVDLKDSGFLSPQYAQQWNQYYQNQGQWPPYYGNYDYGSYSGSTQGGTSTQ